MSSSEPDFVQAIRQEPVDERHEEDDPERDSESELDMFKRLRLHRGSEGDELERNEHGLVTRVRRSLAKNGAPRALSAPPTRPMFATICINNVNRSMEAHCVLQQAGLRVCSFGAGVQVCFPGRKIDTPRVFGFGTTYETMYNKLLAEDEELYRLNGVLKMLERNMRVKQKPQQFQSLHNKQLQGIDVIVCLDYTMFIKVLNDLRMRLRFCFQKKRLHVICLDVEDTPQDAANGGTLALELCQEIDQLSDLNDVEVKKIVVAFEKRHAIEMFYVGLSV